MKNKFLLIIFLVSLVGFTVSCSKDYYDTKKAGEDFLATNLKKGSVDLYQTKYDTTFIGTFFIPRYDSIKTNNVFVRIDTVMIPHDSLKITSRQVFYKNAAVNVLQNGVQYAVYWTDPNGAFLQFTDAGNLSILAKYKISFIDGTEFKPESTENVVLASNITFWQSVIPKMRVGSKWRVWVPYSFAYGSDGAQNADKTYNIDPYTVLVYDIELLKLN